VILEHDSWKRSRDPARRYDWSRMPKKSHPHDPGGKVKIGLKDGVAGTAQFGGRNDEYRYRLTRTWKADKPYVLFVLMNPSTADPNSDDPTIAKCCRFARAWGFGGMVAANTFAYRCTDQKRLTETLDPIGPDNDKHIMDMAKKAGIVVLPMENRDTGSCDHVEPCWPGY
jgi:hypothetical protein